MQKTARRKICVVTGSRAEYGIAYWLMREIESDPALRLQVIVTGMHLEKKFGFTYREIETDGFSIDAKVDMRLVSDNDEAIAKSMALAVAGLASAYKRLSPDIVVLLGDKLEILAAASAALISRIPIAHIHGGEITEGAYDDSVRHAVTKMADLHFVACGEYGRRVIQMGEDPGSVFNFGAPGLDNIRRTKLLDKSKLGKELGIEICEDLALVTFHPVTREKGMAKANIRNLLRALDKVKLRIIFTMPNADAENNVIFQEIKRYVRRNRKTARMFCSMGRVKYLSLLRYCRLMIGNSSSGIIEAPSFALPVVNIGTRQKGRVTARNVINTAENAESIRQAIEKAMSGRFRLSLRGLKNPFGSGTASKKIKDVLKRCDLDKPEKRFKDLKW